MDSQQSASKGTKRSSVSVKATDGPVLRPRTPYNLPNRRKRAAGASSKAASIAEKAEDDVTSSGRKMFITQIWYKYVSGSGRKQVPKKLFGIRRRRRQTMVKETSLNKKNDAACLGTDIVSAVGNLSQEVEDPLLLVDNQMNSSQYGVAIEVVENTSQLGNAENLTQGVVICETNQSGAESIENTNQDGGIISEAADTTQTGDNAIKAVDNSTQTDDNAITFETVVNLDQYGITAETANISSEDGIILEAAEACKDSSAGLESQADLNFNLSGSEKEAETNEGLSFSRAENNNAEVGPAAENSHPLQYFMERFRSGNENLTPGQIAEIIAHLNTKKEENRVLAEYKAYLAQRILSLTIAVDQYRQ